MTHRVDFYLDPGCPWTWLTSRWLVAAAEQRDLTVTWRPFSLELLHAGRPMPPQFDTPEQRAKLAHASRALKVLTSLSIAGDSATGRFYTEFGRRFHDGEEGGIGTDPVAAAAAAAGVEHAVAAVDDPAVDEVIAASLEEALAIAGPEVGSPVLRIDSAPRGFHGPIVSPRIEGPQAGELFDHLAVLQGLDSLFEVKRGRSGPPAVGSDR